MIFRVSQKFNDVPCLPSDAREDKMIENQLLIFQQLWETLYIMYGNQDYLCTENMARERIHSFVRC